MFNVRLLDLPTATTVAREVAKIEPFPERVAAVTPKVVWHTLHASNVGWTAAVLLKQELLSLDADCVVSPDVYLGQRDGTTDVLLWGTTRQLRALCERLRAFPINDLRALADEVGTVLDATTQVDRGELVLRDQHFRWGERTFVMGIVNVTPDSFSGDGLLRADDWLERAVMQATEFAGAKVHIIDVGGESTRPGAAPVTVDEERERVVPVTQPIRAELPTPISVDTWKAEVAAAALDAGADMVNDVWGLRTPDGGWNEALAQVVAERNVPIILMHNRRAAAHAGPQGGQYRIVQYDDLMGDILHDLSESIAFAVAHGIPRAHIIVDPGIGFGKTPDQNIEVLRRLCELTGLGLPILLGTSRKSFIGLVLDLPPDQRAEGTAATVALGIHAGADIVRVHDVVPIMRVARMTDAVVRGGQELGAKR